MRTPTPANALQRFWLSITETFQHLGAVPFVVGVQLILAILLVGTEQGADLAHSLFEGEGRIAVAPDQAAAMALGSVLLGLQSWFWARRMVEDACPDRKDWNPLITWGPRVLGVAPALIAAGACIRSEPGHPGVGLAMAAIAVAFGVFLTFRKGVMAPFKSKLDAVAEQATLINALASMVLIGLIAWDPVTLPRFFGSIGTVYIGLAFLVGTVGGIIHWGRKWRLPVLGGLILWAVFLSGFAAVTGDNHAAGRRMAWRTHAGDGGRVVNRTFDQAFDQWYAQAPTVNGVKPMIVVAAAGGASRAGFWAAEALARLHQDSAGAFSASVIAVSSVSGGSVGAAAYVSQLYEDPDWKRFRPAVERAAGGDFLSPAMAGLLFTDLAAGFIPVVPAGGGSVFALPDRAEALELAFEAGWRDHCRWPTAPPCRSGDEDLWSRPFVSLWRDNRWTVPLMFVNGARADDGRRVLTAPVVVRASQFPNAVDFYAATGEWSLPVSSAIHNGARFPLVSPGGTLLERSGHPNGHILDGGYFENSGLSTAADIVHAAVARWKATHPDGPSARAPAIRPIVIELDNDTESSVGAAKFDRTLDGPSPYALANLKKTSYLLGAVAGPLSGLAGTRDGRGNAVAEALARELDGSYFLLHLCNTQNNHRKAPMNWVLSRSAKRNMRIAAVDNANLCGNRQPVRDLLAAVHAEQAPRKPAAAGPG